MNCPQCNGSQTKYDEVFDYWTCTQCSRVWSEGKNDPDYDDDVPQAQEAIAKQNIEAIDQWGHE